MRLVVLKRPGFQSRKCGMPTYADRLKQTVPLWVNNELKERTSVLRQRLRHVHEGLPYWRFSCQIDQIWRFFKAFGMKILVCHFGIFLAFFFNLATLLLTYT